MSGHSKWANIKHRKGAQDAKRAKIFTRIIKEITIASRDGGGGLLETNPSLRLAVQNAKGVNMPKDTIERAIKKGLGTDADSLTELTFEGYAPHGVGVFVECTTDNNNRTIASIRSLFNKYHGSLGTNGSLGFIFDRKGIFTLDKINLGNKDLDELEMDLIEFGMEDMERLDEKVIITSSFDDFGKMSNGLENLSIPVESAEIQRIPNSTATLTLDQAKSVLKMIDKMEEDEDVNSVYHNLELTDDLMADLSQ